MRNAAAEHGNILKIKINKVYSNIRGLSTIEENQRWSESENEASDKYCFVRIVLKSQFIANFDRNRSFSTVRSPIKVLSQKNDR